MFIFKLGRHIGVFRDEREAVRSHTRTKYRDIMNNSNYDCRCQFTSLPFRDLETCSAPDFRRTEFIILVYTLTCD